MTWPAAHGRATFCREKLTQAALSLGANRFALLAETEVLGPRSQAAAYMGGGLAAWPIGGHLGLCC